MATRGRPVGSTNDRVWRDALRKAAFELSAGRSSPRKIEVAARAVVNAAVDGDMTAAKELGDRLDGKAPQALHHGAYDGGPLDLNTLSDEDLNKLASLLASGIESNK